jgi:hypothetical protein
MVSGGLRVVESIASLNSFFYKSSAATAIESIPSPFPGRLGIGNASRLKQRGASRPN